MQVEVRLLHCDGGRRVVLASAREGDRLLGSALGEGATAEEAEDRARARLLASLGTSGTVRPPARAPAPRPETEPPSAPTAPPPPQVLKSEPVPEEREEAPEDWSGELTRLDLQMRRIGWDREREATYLQRCFGHPSRDRITVYADLMAFLQMAEALEPDADPASAPVPLRRRDLLQQCDQLLLQLGWDGSKGRRFLEQHLGVSSRRQLKDSDLLRFNMLLEEETLQGSGFAPPEGEP